MTRWRTGDVVTHRYVGHGDAIVWGRPHVVVSDGDDLVVLFQPEGTVVERYHAESGTWLEPHTVRMNILRLMYPGRAHAVLLFFDAGTGVPPWYAKHFDPMGGPDRPSGSDGPPYPPKRVQAAAGEAGRRPSAPSSHDDPFKGWKIDLESPFVRTEIGFDTTDNTLDVMVRPDLSWYWKDEAATARRIRQGVYTLNDVRSYYDEGTRAVEAVERRAAPFSEPWPEWRPDPSWPIPTAATGWERLPGREINLNRGAPYRPMRRDDEHDVTIRLVKHGRSGVEYPGRIRSDDGTRIVVEAPWSGHAVDLGVVRFEPGDMFLEQYWRDRWYTVKRCVAADGTVKGWYCDAVRPTTLEGAVLTSVDLELDLWVPADGGPPVLLDEDEFLASGLPQRDPAAAAQARAAMDDLERLARERSPLFS